MTGAQTVQAASMDDLPAFKLGNWTDGDAGTGTTVVVAPAGALGACDVRGGGPATRETDALRPENMAQEVHAVVLSGGSAFGLAAATGVVEELERAGIGLQFAGMCVPIVPAACLFDLIVGDAHVRPDARFGVRAVQAALSGEPFAQGNFGAGTGASVGKILGMDHAMKSGLGLSVVRFNSLVVGAVVAVNACGTVFDAEGTPLAGIRGKDGAPLSADEALPLILAALEAMDPRGGSTPFEGEGPGAAVTNTTIGCVMTNAKMTKAQAAKVAAMAHDAFGRAINPVHTPNDGDAIFCLSSREVDVFDSVDTVGMLACKAMRQAICNAVTHAEAAYGLPAARK